MTDYKIDRAGADCELGDVPWERSHPELYGTADDYYDALSVLEKRGISPKHRCMLLAHLNAPNHTVTWENLAKACGYASYRSVNLQYGALAHRLADELGVEEAPLREVWLKGWWGFVLVDWADERGSLGHTAYVMRPPLVAALRRLNWKSSSKPGRDGSNRLRCPQCGSFRIAAILWGYLDVDQRLQKLLAAGKVVLGGCLVSGDDPEHHCNACGFEWRMSPPEECE